MHSNWTIGRKLFSCFIGLLAATTTLSYFGISTISSLNTRTETLVNVAARKVQLVNDVRTAESEMLGAQRGFIIYTLIHQAATTEQNRAEFFKKAAEAHKGLDELKSLLATEEASQYYGDLQSALVAWESAFTNVVSLAKQDKTDEMVKYAVDKTVPQHEKFTAAATQFATLLRKQMKDEADASRAQSTTSMTIAWGLAILAIGIGCVGFWVVRSTNRQLRQIGTELGEGATQVASASTQVSSASQSLAQGASEQAASLEETSASAEEITSMTKKNAENSSGAADVMAQVDRKVSDANRTLSEMVVSMHEINASSDKIARIIKVIDEIAFQTNILALNAAVEAARAGEAGMGFAVVADEVRNLAQRCAQAAKDTAALIEESITKANEGRTKLEEVNSSIGAITDSAAKVKTLVDEVNLGSQEQARGIDQIAKAIGQMEQVTQKTAANAEESASASEEMSSQAQVLQSLVNQLQGMVGGGTEAVPARPAQVKAARKTVPGAHTGSIASLAKATGLKTAAPVKKAETARVAAGRDEFPLDEDFREF